MDCLSARIAAAVFLIAVAAPLPDDSAQAYTLKTLYSFCAKANCVDGQTPNSQPAMDASGNLYLTTGLGGKSDAGAVIEFVKTGADTWKEKVIYSFRNQGDGAIPVAGVIIDVFGNLYGTTISGGGGTVYEISPKIGKTGWTGKTLYQFRGNKAPLPEGEKPSAKLSYAGAASGAFYDGVSPLYGTTSDGGFQGIAGTAFELTPNGAKWTEKTIHSFCSLPRCEDGEEPRGEVMVDGSGALIGTTYFGGTDDGDGVVFSLARDSGIWKETVLHAFCEINQCVDGIDPVAGVMEDTSGNIFGTTSGGGVQTPECARFFGESDCGTVFELESSGDESLLYSFCAQPNCTDGAFPFSTLVPDNSGNMIGTTYYGGTGAAWDSGRAGSGTVFSQNGETHTVLYSFCSVTSECLDGAEPDHGVLIDAAGNIYGTTTVGGTYGKGTVFELSP